MIETLFGYALVYIVAVLMTNVFWLTMGWGVKIPYKKKQFKLKYNPIYKLESMGNWEPGYSITKYELQWIQSKEEWWAFFIPFGGAIKLYRYSKENTSYYGNFTKEQIRKGFPKEGLEVTWNMLHEQHLQKIDDEAFTEQNFKSGLNQQNKIFNDNYEK